MTLIIRKSHQRDCSLQTRALANNQINKSTVETIARFRGLADRLPAGSLARKRIKMLCNAVSFHITAAALSCGLFFRASKPLAVISGAGIAGLAASFVLRARGFNVVIVEKRKNFSRFNIINLNVEIQPFLREFKLLEKFEERVASRIKEHRYVLIKKDGTAERIAISDVSRLKLEESVSFEPENFCRLFNEDGIYSAPIEKLQTSLAEEALKAGVSIFGDINFGILSRTPEGGISKVQITFDRVLQPDLFFIAEGAHSSTAHQLGMRTRVVKNACTDENWIFGNMTYSGRETFVVSIIDASQKTLRLANVIFNAKSQVINVAVTSNKGVHEDSIREQILQTVRQVFEQRAFPFEEMHSKLLVTVSKPSDATNRTCYPFSMGNVFCIGDSAGSSSPLGAIGGTSGLTVVPVTVRRLLNNCHEQSPGIHDDFYRCSEAYTSRAIQKSENNKKLCINFFDKERSSS